MTNEHYVIMYLTRKYSCSACFPHREFTFCSKKPPQEVTTVGGAEVP